MYRVINVFILYIYITFINIHVDSPLCNAPIVLNTKNINPKNLNKTCIKNDF